MKKNILEVNWRNGIKKSKIRPRWWLSQLGESSNDLGELENIWHYYVFKSFIKFHYVSLWVHNTESNIYKIH